MSNYSDIRKYFNERVKAEDNSLKEWKDALVFEDASNIPSSILDNRYHIELSNWSSTPANDTSVEDRFTVVLTIFKKGFTTPQDSLDNLLDKALCIRHGLINPKNVESFKVANSSGMDAVENLSGSPGEIDISNDNIIKIALEFNVRLYFCAVS
jgi:hypothetical protein